MSRYISIVILTLFISCKNDNLPKGILPESKMREVLWDVMRADEWVSYEYNIDTSVNKYVRSIELYQQALQIHNIKAEQFQKSFRYYQSHPKLLKPIFDSLQQRTNKTIAIETVQ